ncbi:hypothetical protein IMCC21224_111918 [Puniceibacterium sp. IMCC21224]|nr:hypothetical protein IMCC21224_111918 [Puniceibacterium sp. IMCC21224]
MTGTSEVWTEMDDRVATGVDGVIRHGRYRFEFRGAPCNAVT